MIAFPLLQMLILQSWQVAVLAIAVWGITRYLSRDRAYLCHMLWAIVLIKCLTPPLWSSPVGIFSLITHHAGLSLSPPKPSGLTQPSVSKQRMPSNRASTLVVMSNQRLSPDQSSDPWGFINRWQRVGDTLAGLWLTVTASFALYSIGRYVLFWRWVKQTTCDTPVAVVLRVKNLSERLRLAKNIQVRVVDSWIGPAVCGLWNPTIVLPQSLVLGRTEKEIEPLIAHELVHIRRGDLWMALLQSLASSLAWFHPMVWFASRQMTIESERCCDEATIALLQCKPAVYARSLLAVLEWKHWLRVAPALPGVRPVDITSARLERIMRLGQGSRSRSPWWVWCIALFVSGASLPGAPFVGAQPPEKKEGDLEAAKQLIASPIAPVAATPLLQPPRLIPAKDGETTDAKVIQVEIRIVDIKPDTEEFKKIEQILNAQSTQPVPVLPKIPYVNRLFHSSVQLARHATGDETLHMQVGLLPIQQYQKIVSDELRGPGSTVVSSPRLMIENGQTGQVTVGQMEEGKPERLTDGYSLTVRPSIVDEDTILVLYEMTRARTEKRPVRDEQKSPNLDSSNLPAPVRTTSINTSVVLDQDKAIVILSPTGETDGSMEIAFVTCSSVQDKK